MTEINHIEELGRQIGQQFNPQKVILFGSYASGTVTEDSDVDILVVIEHKGKNWRMATEIRNHLHNKFPLDLLVRTPEQLQKRLAMGDCFLKEITEKGKVLYESSN